MIQKRSIIDPGLYEADETAWLEAMSELIEQGRFDELDYEHLGEYLSDMAKRDRREVESRLTVLIAHLLKWTHQRKRRTRNWRTTILVQQRELVRAIGSDGVLRNHAESYLPSAFRDAVKEAMSETGLPKIKFPSECPYTVSELMSADIPDAQ